MAPDLGDCIRSFTVTQTQKSNVSNYTFCMWIKQINNLITIIIDWQIFTRYIP